MGFFARLFGSSKSAPSATVAPEDGAPKPESEVVQAQEEAVASPPEAVQSIAQEPEPAPPEQPTASAPEAAPEAAQSEPAPPEQPTTIAPEATSSTAPEADESEPEDDEEDSEPEPAPEPFPVLALDEVIYVLTTFGVDSIDPTLMATKKVYRAGSRQAAVAFLRTQVVTETLSYIEVETPDGPFGIDVRQRVFNQHGHFVDF